MKLTIKRFSAAVLAGAFAASLYAPQCVSTAFAESVEINVSNAQELFALAKNCSLDSWSKGKTVNLTADINLNGDEFSPIPIFGGTFNGNGHTIAGLKITAEGSSLGLFRYVEQGGTIDGLNVSGAVAPVGTQNNIGGIAGMNCGTLKNCKFNGSIFGESNVGGIAGNNAGNGKLISCSSSGSVHGKTGTGGVAGNNSGSIVNCENNAGINLTQNGSENAVTDIDIDKLLGETETDEGDNLLNSTSDTGGIAGYSDGVVQSCQNNGNVGYPHVGYNVGGIAGRQSGYLSGCSNNGNINGRKEVGGIVGQTEPYLSITPSEELLDELHTELSKLTDMTDDILDSAQSISGTAYESLTKIKDSADSANNSVRNISNSMDDFVNDNVNAVNMATADILNAIDIAKPAADDLSEIGGELSQAAELLSQAVEELKGIPDTADVVSADAEEAISGLQSCSENIKSIAAQIKSALDMLQTSVIEDDAQAFKEAVEAFKKAVDASAEIFNDLARIAEKTDEIYEWVKKIEEKIPDVSFPETSLPETSLPNSLPEVSLPETSLPNSLPEVSLPETSLPDSLPELSLPETSLPNSLPELSLPETSLPNSLPELSLPEISLPDSLPEVSLPEISLLNETAVSERAYSSPNDIKTNVDDLSKALTDCVEAIQKIADSLPTVKSDADNAKNEMKGAAAEAENAAENLRGALESVRKAFDDITPANDSIRSALDMMSTAADRLSYAGTLFKQALGHVSKAMESLSGTNRSPFKPLSGSVRQDSDNLFDSLSKMFEEADKLTEELNDQNIEFTEKLKAVNRQIGVITDLVIEEINAAADGTEDLSWKDHIQDTSEEDITATREGKVADCRNKGAVEGDRNIGGVAGSMAIEYDLDPEDDVTGKLSVRARYETKSVVQGCVNYGEVTAKKDSAGGVAGKMDLGTLISCENYGNVSGADNVGGAAGYSNASVRNCFSKARLSGDSHVGGIAGFANRVSGCRSIVSMVDSGEFTGAIAGSVKEDGSLKDNFFIDTGVAGVDGISYAGKAEPVSFEKFSALEDMPVEMLAFNIILNADGELVRKIPFTYGQDLSKITLPAVPEKEDNYGTWSDFDKTGRLSDVVVEAEYKHIVTITQSAEADGKLALALASGSFTDEAKLSVEEQNVAKPVGAGKNAKIYKLTLKNTNVGGSDKVPVRILNPGKNKSNVWVYSDGKWSSVSAEQSGKYMLAEMTGAEGIFCIASPNTAWVPFAAGGGAAVIALVIILCVRRSKKRKAGNKTSKKTVKNK